MTCHPNVWLPFSVWCNLDLYLPRVLKVLYVLILMLRVMWKTGFDVCEFAIVRKFWLANSSNNSVHRRYIEWTAELSLWLFELLSRAVFLTRLISALSRDYTKKTIQREIEEVDYILKTCWWNAMVTFVLHVLLLPRGYCCQLPIPFDLLACLGRRDL